MKKENYRLKVAILCFAFIPSLTLFWDIVTIIAGYRKCYMIFQFQYTASFTICSIFLTKDAEHFHSLLKNNVLVHKCVDKILHASSVIFVWSLKIFLIIPILMSSNADIEKEAEISKLEAKEQIEQYDNMPIAARTLLPVAVATLAMAVLVYSNVCSEQIVSLIHEVLNTLIGLVGLFFVIMNVKDTDLINQNNVAE